MDKFNDWMSKRIVELDTKHDETEDIHKKISAGAKAKGYKEIQNYYCEINDIDRETSEPISDVNWQ